MNTITRPQVQFDTTLQRQAGAIDEIRMLHAEHEDLKRKSEEDRRTIQQLQDRCSMLIGELRTSQQEGKIYQRKLIRLASAMTNIGRMSQDAEEIMRSVQDWEETEQQAAEEADSERAAVANLPQPQ